MCQFLSGPEDGFVVHFCCNRLHHKTFKDIYKFSFKNYYQELCNLDIFGKML